MRIQKGFVHFQNRDLREGQTRTSSLFPPVKCCHGRGGGREGGGSVMVRVGSCVRARAYHPIG